MPSRLAYLISQYPAINHTFMMREVLSLRSQGWEIETFSIRPPDRPLADLSEEERGEQSRTRYVKDAGLGMIIGCHASRFLRGPLSYASGLFYALRSGRKTLGETGRRVLYFGEAVVVGEWMLKLRLNHVHSHYSPMIALLVSRMFDIGFSMTVHGPDEFADPVGGVLGEKIKQSRLSVAISYFAQSQMMLHSAPEDWSKIRVGYLGVPETKARPELWQRKPGAVRLLCVGRLAPVKGQHVLVEAARLLKERNVEFALTIAGGGPHLEWLRGHVRQQELSDQVKLPGFVSHEDLARMYQDADVFVLPSFAEGVPGVLMEAMSNCVPCITTYVNGVPELVEDNRSGLLVTPSDAQGLADAMQRLIESEELRTRLGLGGFEQVRSKFDLTRNAGRLGKYFDEVIAVKTN